MQITIKFFIINIIFITYAFVSFLFSTIPALEEAVHVMVPRIPETIGDWTSRELKLMKGEIDRNGTVTAVRRIYEKKQDSIGVLIIREGAGKRGIHSPVNCFTANGWVVDGQYSEDCAILELDRTFHFQVLNLSFEKKQIVSYHTILYDGKSYDSFLVFMAVRVMKTIIGINKPAWLLRLTSTIPLPHSLYHKDLIRDFSRDFIPAAFDNSLQVKPLINDAVHFKGESSGTGIAM